MKLLNLTRPLNNEEISQMHAINQANSPDVGDIQNVNQFKSLIDLSETIYAYKDKNFFQNDKKKFPL